MIKAKLVSMLREGGVLNFEIIEHCCVIFGCPINGPNSLVG